MSKPRGGQPKHWAEKARVQSWYSDVRRRCNWSDYRLDYEFAWTEEGQALRSADDSRPRTFEWIRKASRKPRGLDSRWRGMNELVIAVEKNSHFHGTLPLYEAEIWDLLQDTAPMPETVLAQVDRLLTTNKLVRLPAGMVSAESGALLYKFGLPGLFDRCLRLSLRRMDQFSQIALTWLLYLLTEPTHSANVRTVLESVVDRQLDNLFADYFPHQHLNYYEDAIGVLLQTRLDLSTRSINGYGAIESIGTWPVIPEVLARKLTEEHLLPEIWIATLPDSSPAAGK